MLEKLAQAGVLSDPTPFVEFMVFTVDKSPSAEALKKAIAFIDNTEVSIAQKDPNAGLSITRGFSRNGWELLFNDLPMPKELHDFPAMEDDDRKFPSTSGDIFFMIKSTRMDLNFQAAKYLKLAFEDFATLKDDIQGFKYLDNRDMIDFVDGTENPKQKERVDAVLVNDDIHYMGGSYLAYQIYIDKEKEWDALTAEEQEGVIGRTKWDDIEISDDKKKPFAHNVKSKVETDDGEELKMYRQNRAFGNAKEHGTVFAGFAKSPQVLETSLKQMITADEDGHFDHLLKFVTATEGINFFMPPLKFFEQFGD